MDKDINFTNQLHNILKEKPKIIGLGESTHGTKDFWELRAEFINLISKTKLFKRVFILLENNFLGMENIEDYIQNPNHKISYTNKPFKLTNYTQYQIYDSPDFLSFLKFLKQINSESFKIHFTGIDIYQDLLQNKKFRNEINKKKASYYYNKIKKIGNTQYYRKYIKHLIKQIPHYTKSRDYLMFKNIQFLIENYDSSKTLFIFLGHNGHIAIKNDNTLPAGYYLSKLYKKKYVSIGLCTSEGKFRAISIMENENKFKYFSEPKIFPFVDYGSLKNYYHNEHKHNKIVFAKSKNLSCPSFGHAYYKDIKTQILSYQSLLEFNYFIYKPKTSALDSW